MGASVSGGGGSKGGRRARSRRHAPMSEINVTPFVDVMLVLLIIFMVAAPLLTTGVPLELPQAKGKELEATKEEPLVVNVRRDGQVFLGTEDKNAIGLDELEKTLTAIAKARKKGLDEPVFVRGDKALEYGVVMRVMARIGAAGFRKVSLVAEAEGKG
jgi:biopolymer transport protein TolR